MISSIVVTLQKGKKTFTSTFLYILSFSPSTLLFSLGITSLPSPDLDRSFSTKPPFPHQIYHIIFFNSHPTFIPHYSFFPLNQNFNRFSRFWSIKKMASKSDFAQKLLHDLRLRKERMGVSQSSARPNATTRGTIIHFSCYPDNKLCTFWILVFDEFSWLSLIWKLALWSLFYVISGFWIIFAKVK